MSLYELDQVVIGILKYVRMVILACLKNQVKNHSKIENSVNNQKSVAFDGHAAFNWFISVFKPRIRNHQI